MKEKVIYTIGHSKRPLEDFIAMLKGFKIEKLIDVRSIPRSRFNPHFNKDTLEKSLKKHQIDYYHLTKLGGMRDTAKDSVNLGWKNLHFRGFADYMQTPDFQEVVEELEALGKEYRCAIMCAEAAPSSCHRSLISDALTVRKWDVFHIISVEDAKPHELTSFLHVKKGQLTYT